MKLKPILITAVVATFNTVMPLAGGEETVMIIKTDMIGIENFSQIDGSSGFAGTHVGFGGATQPAAMSGLKQAGFATVINLRLADEDGANVDGNRAAAAEAGLNYIHQPFNPKSLDFTVINDFMAAVRDSANQPVYMHCGSATRAAAMWMIGRVLVDGLEIDQARSEVEAISMKPDDAVAAATAYINAQR